MTEKHNYDKERSSKWNFIVYVESVPDNFIEILKGTHIPMAISPLHQPDNEQLKEHYHIVVDFGNGQNKTQKQVKNVITDAVNGTLPFITDSPIGYYEYLIHFNDKDKQQFDKGFDAITHINGFDKEKYVKINENYMNRVTLEIIQIIEDECICEFCDLVMYLVNYDIDKLSYVKKDSYFYNSFMRSLKCKVKKK